MGEGVQRIAGMDRSLASGFGVYTTLRRALLFPGKWQIRDSDIDVWLRGTFLYYTMLRDLLIVLGIRSM